MGSAGKAAAATARASMDLLSAVEQNSASTLSQVIGLVQKKPPGQIIQTDQTPNPLPKLFTPVQIRGVTLNNRILVSPMCMYSCEAYDGVFSDFHLAHYSSLAIRGAGLVMVEATSVTPEGRLSPLDTGIWNDTQKESLKRIVNVVHASGSLIGLQLAHGGRKSSTYPPYHNFEESGGKLGRGTWGKSEGPEGFNDSIVAPSAIPWKEGFPIPHELSTEEVKIMVEKWAEGAKRAVEAGVDVIEIHAAHGYLIHEFLSGNSNKRTDKYGGNLQNRLRFLLEIITAVRAVIPAEMPLFCRVSGTDYLSKEENAGILSADPSGWDIYQVIELCKQAVPLGLDLIDISSGGNSSIVSKGIMGNEFGFQLPLAETVKKATIPGLLVGSVGLLGDGKSAEKILQEEKTDVLFCARQFLKDPNLVYTMAEQLEDSDKISVRRALQYSWMWAGYR